MERGSRKERIRVKKRNSHAAGGQDECNSTYSYIYNQPFEICTVQSRTTRMTQHHMTQPRAVNMYAVLRHLPKPIINERNMDLIAASHDKDLLINQIN